RRAAGRGEPGRRRRRRTDRAGPADEPGHRVVDGPHRRGPGRRHQRRCGRRAPARRARRHRGHRRPDRPGRAGAAADRAPGAGGGAGGRLPIGPRGLAWAGRRHLRAAARRRLTLAEAGGGQLGVVGFADMVGFTALSQQLTRDELAGVVDQFERLTFDVVTAHGGRVVKMIGDEVMFTVDAPRAAAEIALALVEGGRRDDQVSDMRVGLAYGPLIEREGDLYGPVVNLASRITAIAFPGTVVVDAGLREHLAGDPGYVLRTMRPRYLKDIGRVKLWVLRRAGPPEARFAARRRALREAVSARVEPGDDDAAAG